MSFAPTSSGFIKAEVIGFEDLVEAGSVANAKVAGKARNDGKEYIVKGDDVTEFRFNVYRCEV